MNTRTAPKDCPERRQERFASSPSAHRGLLGNLVAKRCARLADPKLRELVYFLADLSWREPGLRHSTCNHFPAFPWPSDASAPETAFQRLAREIGHGPELPEILEAWCLDPAATTARVPVAELAAYKAKFEAAARARIADTATVREVWELLDYAHAQRVFVLGEGAYRVGKSLAAQAFSQSHLGTARYVQLTSASDDYAFYGTIARALGVACGSTMKAAQIRFRIEQVLREQHLLLIIDEADWLLPQAVRVREVPQRLSWVLTALCNGGVPVALIGSRNFTRLLKNVEARCSVWGAEQLHGRLRLRKQLPDKLPTEDLFKIAEHLLPNSEPATIQLIVGHALKSAPAVPAIESAVARARWFADERGNASITFEDALEVLREAGTIPAGTPQPSRARPAKRTQTAAAIA